MNPTPSLDQLRTLLEGARRMFVLRTAARAAAVIGLIVVLTEIGIAVSLWKKNPASWRQAGRYIPAGLALTLLGAGVAGLVAWRRHRELEPIAERAQKQFPELGLRLSASLEAPALAYCPPALRAALWQDALARVGRTPWKQFTRRGAAVGWAILFLLILLLHIGILFPRLLPSVVPKQIEKAFREQIAGEPPKPKLEITAPGKDQWASQVESIPLTVRAESPEDLARMKLKVSVNGEPAKDIPLDAKPSETDRNEATASLDLTKLGVKEYDVVSYSVVAEEKQPDGTTREVASQMLFVQVEPLGGDLPVAETMPTDGMRKFVDLVNLLAEEQRQVIRDTWELKSMDPQSDAHREKLEKLIEAEKRLAERAKAAYEEASKEFGNAVPKEMLLDLDEARSQMEAAVRELEKKDGNAALPAEQKALSGLVDILRDVQEAAQRIEELLAADQLKQLTNPATPALAAADSSDLGQLVRQQAQINQDAAALEAKAPTLAPAEALAQRQAIAARQQELAKKTTEEAAEKNRGEAAKQSLEQATQAMNENAAAMTRIPPSSPNTAGQQAQQLLERAAAREVAEQQARQASQLRRMVQRMAADQGELMRGEAATPEKQAAIARDLAAAKDQLKAMAAQPQAVAAETLKDAAQKSEDAAKPFSENKGAPETLTPPMEAAAKAYEQTVGRAAHLVQLRQDLQNVKEQMQAVQQKLGTEPAKPQPPSKDGKPGEKAEDKPGEKPGETNPDAKSAETLMDAMESLEERQVALQIELKVAMGITEAMTQLEKTLAENRKVLKEPVTSWTVYGGAYANIGDWIKAINRLQTELDAQIQTISQADLLRAMQNEDAPPEYRELVNAYFERLSRETGKTDSKKPE